MAWPPSAWACNIYLVLLNNMSNGRATLQLWQKLVGWRPYFIIGVMGFLLYSQTLLFNFTYLDDSTLIVDHAPLLSNIKNIGYLFTTDVFMSGPKFYYRPLLNLSLMLDAQVGGALSYIYHLDNILLHLVAAGLIFYLLWRLTQRRALAFWLSLIFLVHPVLTQAVAWIPGRNDSLLTIWALAAFAVFRHFVEKPRLLTYLGYLGLLFLALLTKESAIALPLLMIGYAYFIHRGRLLKADWWLLVLGSSAVGVVWWIMRALAINGNPIDYVAATGDIIHNSSALLIDLGKLFFPVNLSVLPVLQDTTLIYGLAALLLLVAALFFSHQKRSNYIIFGISWFLLFLLPSFIRINSQPDFLEHRLYLPFLGWLLVLAEIDVVKNWDFTNRPKRWLAGLIIVVLLAATWWHSAKFSDRLTFWQSAVASSPHSPLAQRNLGVMYYFQGDFDSAIKSDERAIALNPQEPMVHNNLGVIYRVQKKYDLAEQAFKAELTVNPDYDNALFNLGDLYYQEQRFTESGQLWQETLQVNPAYREAYQRLLILQNKLR
jgi:tetratricopeptide (TPR) repeat protein